MLIDSIDEVDIDFCIFGLALHTLLFKKTGWHNFNVVHVKQIKHRTSNSPLNKCINGKIMLNRFVSVGLHRDELLGLFVVFLDG